VEAMNHLISLSVEEKLALIKLFWSIQSEDDERYIESAIKRKFWQICAVCPQITRNPQYCAEHGCYLLTKEKINLSS